MYRGPYFHSSEFRLDIWVYIAAGAVFFIGIIVYVMFMIFLPEWVGISGKVAREAEASHRGDAETDASTSQPSTSDNDDKKS